MLVKDKVGSVKCSVIVSNFKNIDRSVSVNIPSQQLDESDCSENLAVVLQPNTFNGLEKSDHIADETGGKLSVPEGYQLLPEKFFSFENIPLPLVSLSWLKRLSNGEESIEDCISLAKLKKIIKRRRFKKKVQSVLFCDVDDSNELNVKAKRTKKPRAKIDLIEVNRKRGRPKKQITETPKETHDIFKSEENEPFWNYESDFSNHDPGTLIDDKIENKEGDADGNISNPLIIEPDYFKSTKNAVQIKPEDGDKKKRKRVSSIQGVKIGDSKISFPCSECGKTFSAASTLRCHQRIHNGTLLICPECHKGFVSKYLLKCHMRIHNGDLFMCHKCGRGFTTSELLKVHSRAHTGDRPFVCNVCGKSFPTSSNMLQHKQIHNSEKKFLCSECGSSFVQKRCLDYHMLTHAEKKNICNVCGKLWARKSDLIEHMRVHTGVKPYCCSTCPQKFSQASSLKRHQLVHLDIKPISCETCNKKFKCQEYYKRHLKKHEKDYLVNDI